MGAAGTAVTAGLLVGLLDLAFEAVIAAVVAVGVVWLALGWASVVKPSRAAMVMGAAIAFVGAGLVFGGQGPVWALLTAAGLVGVALHHRDLLILGIGSIGVLFSLPNLIYAWFPSVAAAALSLLVVGGLLGGRDPPPGGGIRPRARPTGPSRPGAAHGTDGVSRPSGIRRWSRYALRKHGCLRPSQPAVGAVGFRGKVPYP